MKEKKNYPVIFIKPSGIKSWSGGAFSLFFVYSKNNGNFVLKGYRSDVLEYLEKNYTHYFYYCSMWHNKKVRGMWCFWKSGVYFSEPNRFEKAWKYKVTKYIKNDDGQTSSKKELLFKRLPKQWIKEFNEL